jgi:hypothetical protein
MEIKEHMEVIGADDVHIGTSNRRRNCQTTPRLKKFDFPHAYGTR